MSRSSTSRPPAPAVSAERLRWVPETRFGHWFLGTSVWSRYVVEAAMSELVAMLPAGARKPERILDVGSGPGVSLPLLERHFSPRSIIGIDIDPLEIARSRRAATQCRCPVEIRRADAKALPFPDESIDLVLCHQLLHHVVEQEAVLRELYRVLAPGGLILVAESCESFILTAPVRMFFRHPNEVQRSAAEYVRLVREAGFEFGPDQVKTSAPFWSQSDFGIGNRLGWKKARAIEPTQVCIAAIRPRDDHR